MRPLPVRPALSHGLLLAASETSVLGRMPAILPTQTKASPWADHLRLLPVPHSCRCPSLAAGGLLWTCPLSQGLRNAGKAGPSQPRPPFSLLPLQWHHDLLPWRFLRCEWDIRAKYPPPSSTVTCRDLSVLREALSRGTTEEVCPLSLQARLEFKAH